MTTGERLVTLSSLSTGTAMEHFLSIITGAGSGAVVDVIMQEPDTIMVTEQEVTGVQLEDADFGVKIVQKETKIIKE